MSIKISKKVKLVPLKTWNTDDKDFFEQILIYEKVYPVAMTHIDTFYISGDKDNDIYNMLDKGASVKCMMSFEILSDLEKEDV